MKRLITSDDISESLTRIKQRGLGFLLSKLNPNPRRRTKSAFNDETYVPANWWIIPKVRQRLNEKISGDPNLHYEDYVVEKYLSDKRDLRMLALGSGVSNHEIRFALHDQFGLVHCIDLADRQLEIGRRKAAQLGLTNMLFSVVDFNDIPLEDAGADIIFFHASLHHFTQIESLLGDRLFRALKPGGLLIIHEYVGPNRIQLTSEQRIMANILLRGISPGYRIRKSNGRLKNHISGPGWIRMILSDPSEAPESELILPAIHKTYETLEEKQLGGNLLAYVLKDIAHHFIDPDELGQEILNELFLAEDEFLRTNQSDLVFGVYRKAEA